MEIYKSETTKDNSYDNQWIYKLYLFKENNINIGSLILFKDITNNTPFGITIIKGIKPQIGSKMIEVALSDTDEGIMPSENKYLSSSAKNMWLRINNNTIFKTEKSQNIKKDRNNHKEKCLNMIFKVDLKRYHKIKPMNKGHIKETIAISSKELEKLNYKGTANFLKNDLQNILISNKTKLKRKIK